LRGELLGRSVAVILCGEEGIGRPVTRLRQVVAMEKITMESSWNHGEIHGFSQVAMSQNPGTPGEHQNSW